MLDLDTAPGRAAANASVARAMDPPWLPARDDPRIRGIGWVDDAWTRGTTDTLRHGPPAYLEGDDPGLNREMHRALRKWLDATHPGGLIDTTDYADGRWQVLLVAICDSICDVGDDDVLGIDVSGDTEAEALVRALVEAGVVEVPNGP